jgi:RNA polymerase sigma factor (sigma-70 family)
MGVRFASILGGQVLPAPALGRRRCVDRNGHRQNAGVRSAGHGSLVVGSRPASPRRCSAARCHREGVPLAGGDFERLRLAHAQHSLDEPAHPGARESLAETLGGEDRELGRAERIVVLESWLAALPERRRDILRLRFAEDLTQREIGERLGISQVKVSRLMRRSLDRVQAMAAADEERSLRAV